MTPTETAVLSDISLDEPWALVESFATFKREHPRDVNRGMDEVVTRLKKHGLEVTVHRPSLFLSIPGQARVEAGDVTFRAKPPAYSADARNGLSGEIVYIAADQAGDVDAILDTKPDDPSTVAAKIKGHIVVSEGFAFPGMISRFENLGAIGVIAINPGVDIHWGICTTVWGVPDLDDLPRKPAVPAVAVNNPDGLQLIEIAKAGGTITLYTEMEEGWFDSKLPEVFIRGSEEPEKYVLLHGHLDSWDVGVGDNATGNATMLEVARVLWKHRADLKRSVRIAWWPGHSTGRYAGSTWFADHFAIDLEDNCVAQVNCDSPGCRWASEFINLSRMSETDTFVARVVHDVAGKIAQGERPHRAGDYSFNNIGISSYFMLSSTMTDAMREEKGYYAVGGCGGNIAWHTENDRLEIADRDILLRDIKVYAAAVLRTANAEVLPFDWRATAREFLDTIAGYQSQVGDKFDLGPAKAAAEALLAALHGFHKGVASGSIAAAEANAAIHDLARILVPVNFTREARFRHDPAVKIPALPTIADATDLDRHEREGTLGFALTQLTRGQNRVVSALNAATRRVAAAG